MKQVEWEQRMPGDIILVRSPGVEANLIVEFEQAIHPDYPGWVPSHAAIEGFDGQVIEAVWNQMTAVNPDSQYAGMPTQVWRIDRTAEQIAWAINAYLTKYGADGYGIFDLLGFAIEALQRHLGNLTARNQIFWGYVCSMGGLIFLRLPSQEQWPVLADLRDCEVLSLLMMFQANEAQA